MPISDSNRTDDQDNAIVSIGENGSTDIAQLGTKSTGEKSVHVISEISSINATNFSHINRVDVASAARSTSGNSGTLDSSGFGCLTYLVLITAVSGSSPTIQIGVEVSDDGSTWVEFTNTARKGTTGSIRHQRLALGAKYYRYTWIILGSTPEFTFSITSTLKPYLPNRNVTITKYSDIDLTASNNTSSIFQAADCKNLSLVTTRAADGGSNSQWRIQASNDGVDNWQDVTGNISQGVSTTLVQTLQNQAFRFYRLIVTSSTNPGSRVLDIFWGANS